MLKIPIQIGPFGLNCGGRKPPFQTRVNIQDFLQVFQGSGIGKIKYFNECLPVEPRKKVGNIEISKKGTNTTITH